MFFKKKNKLFSQDEFAKVLIVKLKLSIDGLKVISQKYSTLNTEYKNNKYLYSHLNAYEKYLDDPDSIDEILQGQIRFYINSHVETTVVNVEKIFPRIESKEFVEEHSEGEDRYEFENLVRKQINEELFLFYIEERGDSIYPIQNSDLVDLNYSIEDLWNNAVKNLDCLPNVQLHNTEGLYRVVAGGLYESSFMILDLFLRRECSVMGDIVFAIPTRDTLFITGSEDQKNISELRDIIEKIKNEGYSIISDKLFVLNDNNQVVVLEKHLAECLMYQNFQELKQKNEVIFEKELLSENEFASLIIKKLSERIEGVKIISQQRLIIHTEYRDQVISYKYYKCYEDYLNHPEALNQIIDSYFNVTYDTHMHIGVPVESSKIFPIIRNRKFLETLSESEANFEKIIYERYSEELLIFYIESRENSLYFIRRSDMVNFNYSLETLKAKAIENLNNDWNVEMSGGKGLYEINMKGKFASSLILLDIWKHEYFPIDGEIVIAIPNANKIYVTGNRDRANLLILSNFIDELKKEWYPIISDKLFIYEGKRFQVFK